MKHKTSKALYAYWNDVRADRMAPNRFEIDPSRISAILPYTFILERIDPETFRFRLAGTRMCDIFGCELRGTNFLDGWPARDRLPLARKFSVLTTQGAGLRMHMKLATVSEADVECEMLLLPLLHTRGMIDRILGSFAPLATPSWLGDTPATAKHLLANELVWPARDPRFDLARTPAPAEPEMFRARDARIVRSERRQFRVFDGGLTRSDVDKT